MTANAGALKGNTMVITAFKNASDDETIDPSVLQEKLITAAVKAHYFTVVERDRLNQALAEMKIDQTGLIDPKDRKQLGHLLGANYMLIGTISGTADDVSVDARVVAIETGQVITAADYPEGKILVGRTPGKLPIADDELLDDGITVTLAQWSPKEFTIVTDATTPNAAKKSAVIWLVEKNILCDAQDVLDSWRPEIAAKIYRQPERYILGVTPREEAYYVRVNFPQIMRDLVFIIFGKTTPRVAINTTEQVLRRPVPDPAVQTTLAKAMLSYGFQVLDAEQAKKALSRESILQALTGDANASRLVEDAAGELHADIFALGESFAEERSTRDGFDARIEFRVVAAATAQLLASIQKSYCTTPDDLIPADRTSAVLAKYALQKGAEATAIQMCSEMLKAFGQPVYRLRVWKVNSYDQRAQILDGLKRALPGATVDATTFDVRSTHSAVFTIRTKKSADVIAQALAALVQPKIALSSIECRSLVGESK
jgi:TolB-like protein